MTHLRIACLALLLGAAPVARATVVVDESIADMSRRAAVVARAVVTAQRVMWSDDHARILTKTYFETTEALKGAPGETITLQQVGGAIGDEHLAVQGLAKFQIGEDVVLFLEPHPASPGEFMLSSMAASKFTLIETASGLVARRSLGGLTLARRSKTGTIKPSALPPRTADGVPYATLASTVRATLPAAPTIKLPSSTTQAK